MKKIYSLLVLTLGLTLSSYGQCTPDPNNKVIGVNPDNIGSICVDKSINQVIQIALPNDTTIKVGLLNIKASFDSVLVTVIESSIPAGITYNCANGCLFKRAGTSGELSRGCLQLIGAPTTPTAAGEEQLINFNVHVWSKVSGGGFEYDKAYDLSVKVLPANDPACNTDGLEDFKMANALSIYPNPSKGNAYLNFDLPSTTSVRINVYDVLGNTVGQLYNGKMSQGLNQISMKPLNLVENGMYMVKIEVDSSKGTRTYTQRMMVK